MSVLQGNPVVHFEVGCKDLEKTTQFYSGLFGWTPVTVPMASLLSTNSQQGIQGHITALGHEPFRYVTFYIEVKDVAECLGRITEAGGKTLVGPVPLPDKKLFAWFSDPEGNTIGLISAEPAA